MNVVSQTEEEKKPRVNEKNMLCNKKKERTGKSQIKWEICYSEKYS